MKPLHPLVVFAVMLLAVTPLFAQQAPPPKPPLTVTLGNEAGQQVMPTMNFYINPSRGPAPLTVKITWKCSAAVGAVASGAWTGPRETAGTETLTVNEKGKYILVCHGNTPDAELGWTIPTTNVDGSPLTNLAGFLIYTSTDSSQVGTVPPIKVANPTATKFIVENLPVGVNYFAMKSYNTNNAESSITGNVTADLPATAIAMERWVTISAYPPMPPTDISARPPGPPPEEGHD